MSQPNNSEGRASVGRGELNLWSFSFLERVGSFMNKNAVEKVENG